MTTFDPRTVRFPHADQSFGAQQYGTPTVPGHQVPGPVPPPPFRPKSKRPLAAKVVAGFVAAGLVVGGAGAWMAFSGSDAEAAVQSTSFAGAHPTTAPFGVDAPQVAAVAATGPQSGDTAGLYAATTPPACTTADFLSQLQADPAKLAAFGGVYGLGAPDVPAFVNSLSPVVLRADTSVTDHPYVDGTFTPQPAVLAAGTAVLVNSYGEPTVKCYNGNPLTGGAPAPDAISVVPTDQVITNYQFTTIDNSTVVVVPGKPDPKPHPGHNPTTTPQPDPELVKKAQEAKQAADQARAEATAAREKADAADTAARIAATNLEQAKADLLRAQQQGESPAVLQALQDVVTRAQNDADTKANQAKYADAAATSAEGTADQADENAKEAQQKADDSAKTPAHTTDQHKDEDATTKHDDPAATAGQGQGGQPVQPAQGQGKVAPKQVQTPVCQQVVTDTASQLPTCPLTGSADHATTDATHTATTDGTKSSTGSTTTSGSADTSNSSKGSSSSDSNAKKGDPGT